MEMTMPADGLWSEYPSEKYVGGKFFFRMQEHPEAKRESEWADLASFEKLLCLGKLFIGVRVVAWSVIPACSHPPFWLNFNIEY